ncbi:unnamed protein product [Ambrosiozyma monospora]|uniref:Unnamed protein product n=1 Tax=Ambrosiozyma monospora TaxID=43982 RepID=A0ACB5T901_AMBMO|nr:unnamed protein product [Ambrosiozyma monospora]
MYDRIKLYALGAKMWIMFLSYYFPDGYIQQIIDSSKSYKDTRKVKKLTSKNFKRFKSIMLSDEIPLDLSLQIWELIIHQVLDLPVVIKLIGHDP